MRKDRGAAGAETEGGGMAAARIWVDADSCPVRIREIVCRAASKRGIKTLFVANRKIPITENTYTEMIVVAKKEGSADEYILDHAGQRDLVITRDIPLAGSCVERGLRVINDRGSVYTEENVRHRLSLRNFMHALRESGTYVAETKTLGRKEIHAFAAVFDRELTKLQRIST